MCNLLMGNERPSYLKTASLLILLILLIFSLFAESAFAQNSKIIAGSTSPGETNWKVYRASDGKIHGIYVDVDTRSAGFSTTPNYITSLGGDGWHFNTVGATSIYNSTPNGFRVYIRYADGQIPTPTFANEKKWHIRWMGIEPTPPSKPTDLTITNTTTKTITLKWYDRSSNEDGFIVERQREGGSWSPVHNFPYNAGTGWVQPWTDRNLSPDTRYCYRVKAFNNYGENFSSTECGKTEPEESQQKYPDIAYVNCAMEPTYSPSPGQPFRAWFYFCNIGDAPTGSFKIRLVLDGGAQQTTINAQSYEPGICDGAFWTFPNGLPVGDHYIYAYFDVENKVREWNENNNIGYLGFSVW